MLTIIYANMNEIDIEHLQNIKKLLSEKGINDAIVIHSYDEIYPMKIEQINTPIINNEPC